MAINLLEMLNGQLGSSVMRQVGNYLGESESATTSALGAILPSILGSVISKGSSDSGAGALLDMINSGNHDGSIFDNLGGMLGGGDATSGLMKTGDSLLGNLMGGGMLGSVLDLVTKSTGFGRKSSSSLMSMIAPMVMGMVGRYVKNKALDAVGLGKFLGGQRSHVASALPAGMGSLLGFAKEAVGGSTPSNTSTTTSRTERVVREPETSGGGGGWMKWAVAALAVLGLFWGLRNFGGAAGDAVTNAAGTMTDAAGNVVDGVAGAVTSVKDAAGNVIEGTIDASGNLVDEFTADAASSAAGAVAGAAGTAKDMATDAAGTAKDMAAGAAGKVAGAAQESGEALKAATTAMTSKFADVFKNKKAGYSYSLNDIEWKEGGNRISNFRKSEVEGLAAALKQFPEAKIVVNADSKLRAQVVQKMLVALGVKAGQISSKGGAEGVSVSVK